MKSGDLFREDGRTLVSVSDVVYGEDVDDHHLNEHGGFRIEGVPSGE